MPSKLTVDTPDTGKKEIVESNFDATASATAGTMKPSLIAETAAAETTAASRGEEQRLEQSENRGVSALADQGSSEEAVSDSNRIRSIFEGEFFFLFRALHRCCALVSTLNRRSNITYSIIKKSFV